jgi:hypothetical protein
VKSWSRRWHENPTSRKGGETWGTPACFPKDGGKQTKADSLRLRSGQALTAKADRNDKVEEGIGKTSGAKALIENEQLTQRWKRSATQKRGTLADSSTAEADSQ